MNQQQRAEDYILYITKQAQKLVGCNYLYKLYTTTDQNNIPTVVIYTDIGDTTFIESWKTDKPLTWSRKRAIKENLQRFHYTIWRCGY